MRSNIIHSFNVINGFVLYAMQSIASDPLQAKQPRFTCMLDPSGFAQA